MAKHDRIMIVIIMIFTIHIVFNVVHDQIYLDIVLKVRTDSTYDWLSDFLVLVVGISH